MEASVGVISDAVFPEVARWTGERWDQAVWCREPGGRFIWLDVSWTPAFLR